MVSLVFSITHLSAVQYIITLGWATAGEVPGVGKFQMFTHGDMIWIDQTGQTYVFGEGVVRVFDVPFTGE